MLYLVGAGLVPEHLSLKGLSVLKNCDECFFEKYTSGFSSMEKGLEKLTGCELKPLYRKDLENDSGKLLALAKEKDIALVVVGDALTATTHSSLLVDAKKAKVEVEVVPGISVYSVAPGAAGLQVYKFGRSTTIVYPEENYYPESFYDIVKSNLEQGLHTMCLLDVKISKELEKFMTCREAAKVLLGIASKRKEKDAEKWDCVALCALGSDNRKVYFGKLKKFMELEDNNSPQTLIVCGELHEVEREYLESFSERV